MFDILQRREERLARQRDDPYYLTDRPSKPSGGPSLNVDAIPIVRLDGLPSLSSGESAEALHLIAA